MAISDVKAGRNPGRKALYQNAVRDGKTLPLPQWSRTVTPIWEALKDPLKWRKPQRIFVSSMSDLFHKDIPDAFIDEVFAIAGRCPQHQFLMLTKRPERAVAYFMALQKTADEWAPNTATGAFTAAQVVNLRHVFRHTLRTSVGISVPGTPLPDPVTWPLPNVWLGTSIENQKTADERIPHLLKCPNAMPWLSYEPALGPVDFSYWAELHAAEHGRGPWMGWIVMGGESGPGARPMHPDWARGTRDQCAAAEVPFFFKQWGEYGSTGYDITDGSTPFRMFQDKQHWVNKAVTWMNVGDKCVDRNGMILTRGGDFDTASYPVAIMRRMGKKKSGRILDGVLHDAFPVVGGAA